MGQFLASKIPQEFEKAARKYPDEVKNALLLALGCPNASLTPTPNPRVQRLATYLVNLRNGFLVAHDENFIYADMYIRTFLK